MSAPPHSDALVFFGATGDLAYKQIFPALQAMVRTGALNVPVVGIARSGWTLEQLRARARDSLEHHGGIDRDAFDKLCSLLRYVDGDYADLATFNALRRELDGAQRPLHYLAIPPSAFGVQGRGRFYEARASASRSAPSRCACSSSGRRATSTARARHRTSTSASASAPT